MNTDYDTQCDIEDLIRILSAKWTARIIYTLSENGQMRFGQIRRAFDKSITTKSLADKLNLLSTQNILERSEVEGPVKEVYYEVTTKGRRIHSAFKQLEQSLASQTES